MKKIFWLTLCMCLLAIPARAANFSDVSSTNDHRVAIYKLADMKVIKGYDNGTFRPGSNVTNRQVAVMLARALELDLTNVKNPGFVDVPTSDSAYKEIAAVTAEGIFPKEQKFYPDEHITRAGMARALQRAYHIEAGPRKYNISDVPNSHWAYQYIMPLVTTGISTGYSDNTFKPSGKLTRAQFSSFMVRAQKHTNDTMYFKYTSNESIKSGEYLLMNRAAQKFHADVFQTHNILGSLEEAADALAMLQGNNIISSDGPDITYKGEAYYGYSKKYLEGKGYTYGVNIRNFDFSLDNVSKLGGVPALFYKDGYYYIHAAYNFRSSSEKYIELIEVYQLDRDIYYAVYSGYTLPTSDMTESQKRNIPGKYSSFKNWSKFYLDRLYFDGLRYAIIDIGYYQSSEDMPYFSDKPITTDKEVDTLLKRYKALKNEKY